MLNQDMLIDLLPAIYRIRDAELAAAAGASAGPLRELLRLLADPLAAIEQNLDQLYADEFIETCDRWVVPYIGDLIGYQSLHDIGPAIRSGRAEVAHTIAFRRRKGTAAVLEQLAYDVTGWDAHVVEFFQRLATTQYMNHTRPAHFVTPSLREWEPLERIGSAFDTIPRTVDVRRIAAGAPRYNIPNVGLFLWPLSAQSVTNAPAARMDDRQWLFSPLGIDIRLVTLPDPEYDIVHIAEPINTPLPISRRVLSADIANVQHPSLYYGPFKSINVNVGGADIPRSDIIVCNLAGDGPTWAHVPPAGKYAIDPELGRLALPPEVGPGARVNVTFHDAFGADIGGGEYDRSTAFRPTAGVNQLVRVPDDVPRIQDAIDSLAAGGVVEVTDNGRYHESLTIAAPDAAHIELRAASGRRPAIVGEMILSGGVDSDITVDGFLIFGGRLRVPVTPTNRLKSVTINHCTLVPGLALSRAGAPGQPSEPSVVAEIPDVTVRIDRSITGGLRIGSAARATVTDSIIDAGDTFIACAAPDGSFSGPLEILNCTVLGRVICRVLERASNSIFTAPVFVERQQQGCVRFSYLPLSSRAPRRHRCQPVEGQPPPLLHFLTRRYGQPSYCQLGPRTDVVIRRGADDEGEMGGYHIVRQPQRDANLRIRLNEYLRAGLQAGIFYDYDTRSTR